MVSLYDIEYALVSSNSSQMVNGYIFTIFHLPFTTLVGFFHRLTNFHAQTCENEKSLTVIPIIIGICVSTDAKSNVKPDEITKRVDREPWQRLNCLLVFFQLNKSNVFWFSYIFCSTCVLCAHEFRLIFNSVDNSDQKWLKRNIYTIFSPPNRFLLIIRAIFCEIQASLHLWFFPSLKILWNF